MTQDTTLSEPLAHIAPHGKRIAVYPRKGTYLYLPGIPDARYNIPSHPNALTYPLEVAHKLPAALRKQYGTDERITIEPSLAERIERALQIERDSIALSAATDAPVPDILNGIKLRPFQRASVAFGEARKSYINAMDMGLGKTAVALHISKANNLSTFWLTKATLVGNLSTEIRTRTGEQVCVFSGRYPSDADMVALVSGQFKHFILNYEVLGTTVQSEKDGVSRPWVEFINLGTKLGLIHAVTADEIHNCRNLTAKRTQALMRIEAPRKIAMTGTAIVNRVGELWPALHWIDPTRFNSYEGFLKAHTYDGVTVRSTEKLRVELVPYLFVRKTADVIKDLPPINRIPFFTSLGPIHAERYKAALQGIYKKLDGTELDINNVLVELNRLRQIVADAKALATVDYISDILDEDPGAKVLAFTGYHDPAHAIARAFNTTPITQDVPPAKRLDIVNTWDNQHEFRVLVGTLRTLGEGFNITSATTVVFNDFDWTPGAHEQAERRAFYRLKDLHGGTSVWMAIEKTVDEFMQELHRQKMASIQAVEGTSEHAAKEVSIVREVIEWLKAHR